LKGFDQLFVSFSGGLILLDVVVGHKLITFLGDDINIIYQVRKSSKTDEISGLY
jgi:hypothetical protein